ncbi:MAG: glycosyltransferase family 2 protein [Bacteroidetes bacterium]|nr:glycosyltransferase family 2 protein [Bacteroidota bacterium]
MTNALLTLVIPIYNEEAVLPKVLPGFIDFCNKNQFNMVLVNDGSRDNSAKIIEQHVAKSSENVIVVSHKLNRGYGGALKSGIQASLTEYSIFIDADGQHRLQDVTNLFQKIRETDADMIIGSRKGQRGNWFRSIGKTLIRSIAKLLMDVPVYDINSGMKIFRTELGKKYLHLYPDTMSFSDIICLVFLSNRHRVLEEPIVVEERKGGKSTIGVMTAFQTVMEILNILTMFNPMKIFLTVSIILFIAGFGWGMKFFLNHLGISVGSSMLMIMSILVFLLGLIAEQLSAIRKNSK